MVSEGSYDIIGTAFQEKAALQEIMEQESITSRVCMRSQMGKSLEEVGSETQKKGQIAEALKV